MLSSLSQGAHFGSLRGKDKNWFPKRAELIALDFPAWAAVTILVRYNMTVLGSPCSQPCQRQSLPLILSNCKNKEASPRRSSQVFLLSLLFLANLNVGIRAVLVKFRLEAKQHLRIKKQGGFISPKANVSALLRGGADLSFPAFLRRCSFLLTEHKWLELTQPGSLSWPPANQWLNSQGMITLQVCQGFRVYSFPTVQCSSILFSAWDFQF